MPVAECPVCATRNTTPYQAIELVAAAVSDRAELEAEVERLRAALAEERARADRLARYLNIYLSFDRPHPTARANAADALKEHDAAREAAR